MSEKVKVSELRIGNYILDTSPYTDKIVYVDGWFINYVSEQPSRAEYIHGIPLSEEWLLRFGLTPGMGGWNHSTEQEPFIIKEFETGVYYYTGDEGYKLGKGIRYVHQLQNLYHAITGEELKDNQSTYNKPNWL